MKFIGLLKGLFSDREINKDFESIAQLQSALEKTKLLKSKYPESYPLQSVIDQLEYLIEIESGKNIDFSKLESINIGIITVREIECRDMALAEDLYEVCSLVKKMTTKYCGR